MLKLITFAVCLGAILGIGRWISDLLTKLDSEIIVAAPKGLDPATWALFSGRKGGGRTLGYLEQTIFYTSFVGNAWAVVAAWLAFKVASKWQSWQYFWKLPDKLEGVDDTEYLIARQSWIAARYVTFLVGTGCNLALGLLGAYLYLLVTT